MNLLMKNKDGSAFYYWKSYQMLEGGTLRLYDGDLFPFKTNILGNLTPDYKNKFDFDGDRFDHSGMVDIYLKFSKTNNDEGLSLEEIRFRVAPKEINKMEHEKKDFTKHLAYEEYRLFDQTYKTYQYKSLKIAATSNITSSRGYLAFYNDNDEIIKSEDEGVQIEFLGKKLKQNIKRHNKQIEKLLKIIPHYDHITEPFEHINYDDSEEHGFGIYWKQGEYNIDQIYAHQKTLMYSKKDINIQLPCCKKAIEYEKGEFVNRWGVSYLRCNDCDKNHPINKNDINFIKEFYKLKDGSDIDYSWQGIEDIFHPDTISFYGWVIRPKTKDTSKVDFMHHD